VSARPISSTINDRPEEAEQIMDQAERLTREREFHNQRFADDSEREERVGSFYDAIRYGFTLYRERVAEACTGRVLLEYGCGNDGLAFDMAARARGVIGIDISDVAIEQAQRAAATRGLTNVTFVVENAEAMQRGDGEVDVVAGTGIVHHLDIPKSMHEVRRVLRTGGVAHFAEPLGHNPVLNWYRNRTPELRTPDEHPLMASDLRTMAREFSSMRVTYFGLVAPLLGLKGRRVDPSSALTKFVWAIDRMLCRIPFVRRYAWYCLVELRA
jgi:ubiquinone/menaquinone biosynthesis C-methylase UbiE